MLERQGKLKLIKIFGGNDGGKSMDNPNQNVNLASYSVDGNRASRFGKIVIFS
jgi:hypothetical protein